MSHVEILPATDEHRESWNHFVTQYSDNPCHLYEWRRILEETYGYKCLYLMAQDEKKLVGVFPAAVIRSRLFGTQICSLPFADYGGILLSDVTESRTIDAFIGFLSVYLRQAKFLEIRTPLQARVAESLSKTTEKGKTEYLTFILDLNKPFEQIWKRDFDKYLRNAIRKAVKNNIEVTFETWGENLNHFYRLYLITMKKLGSPPHGLRFFKSIHHFLGDKHVKLFLASKSNDVIGGVVALTGAKTIYPVYEGINPDYRNLNPASLLFSRIIEWSCNNGYKFFDFGRTLDGSSVYNFKKQWGGMKRSLPYFYVGNEIPQQDLREKYMVLSKLWGKLPTSIAKRLGPFVKGGVGQ